MYSNLNAVGSDSTINIHTIKYGFTKGYVNIYLLETEKGLILIDTGFPQSEEKLWKYLDDHDLDFKEIKLIIITHGHLDHTGSIKEIKEKTKAQVLMHKEDVFMLKDSIKPDIIITDEYSLEEYGLDGRIIHTPGHSLGSISIIIESKLAFIGDIAMRIPLLSPTLNPIIAADKEENYRSWQKLVETGVEILYPAHGRNLKIEELKHFLKKRKKKKK
jgi:glyoxylase-like metal-dependent hydrolase (beta-lactamase superfamily II)